MDKQEIVANLMLMYDVRFQGYDKKVRLKAQKDLKEIGLEAKLFEKE